MQVWLCLFLPKTLLLFCLDSWSLHAREHPHLFPLLSPKTHLVCSNIATPKYYSWCSDSLCCFMLLSLANVAALLSTPPPCTWWDPIYFSSYSQVFLSPGGLLWPCQVSVTMCALHPGHTTLMLTTPYCILVQSIHQNWGQKCKVSWVSFWMKRTQ